MKSIAGLIAAWSRGSAALIASTVEMMFAPGCRKMKIRAAWLPFMSPRDRTVWTESVTLATSDNLTGAPFL